MAAGDTAYWRVGYDFQSPVSSGNGSISITTTAVGDQSILMPTKTAMRPIIRAALERETGQRGDSFIITFRSMYKLVENKDYVSEVQE